MAVCCILLAINIYERDVQKVRISQLSDVQVSQEANLFGDQAHILEGQLNGRQTPLLKFNTRIWNNPRIATMTGYTMEMIREPLYKLAVFVQDNLNPNRLDGFDVEALRTLPNLE
uniref:Uncharacterized protein n=1 Tax=Strombidium inclinatum TaxID=197538 RepID=A0A7S3IMY6_9SPIT|mmetsp:Transcript_27/g.15  ORF Transcript_27/g.15 Transcript_27/m.15 type:complete len:115 (+) Transcript_27:319-663(+)